MARQTRLGDILKPLNSEVGKFTPGWGTTPIMAALIGFILLLLVVMLEVYNSSIVLDGIDVSWTTLGG